MAITTNDLRNGMTLDLSDGLFSVVEFQHVKPGKGGAFVRTKLKNVRTGAVLERTFRADERVEQAIVDKREMQLLYRDGTDYVFMDVVSYDQIHVTPAALGDAAQFVKEGDNAVLQMYAAEIVGVDLPAAVELSVAETEPGVQGDRVSGARQAGHARDRARGPGPAVREPRRANQGRHSLRRVHHPRVIGRRVPDDRDRAAAGEGPRHEARERALMLLYEAEMKRLGTDEVLRSLSVPPDPFTVALVEGTAAHDARIDDLMAAAAKGWEVERMPVLDRNILRLATYELIAELDTPVAVVIDEAVELAKQYSTEFSGGFVNGVLSTIARQVRD